MSTIADFAGVVNYGRSERWERSEQTRALEAYKAQRKLGLTQRQAAAEVGAPRTTLEARAISGATLDSDPVVKNFFESTPGLAFLHQMIAAVHTVFVEVSGCGIRPVCKFLKLTGLNRFVASSFEAQRKYNIEIEQAIVAEGLRQRAKLAETMQKKDITVAQDETFTGGLTLVAMEPESGFILLEEVAEARDTATWKANMELAMQGLKCNIIQSTSDEARALIAYAEKELGANHSPDLFHVQQEMTKAVAAPMGAKIRAAERLEEAAKEEVAAVLKSADEYAANIDNRGAGRPPNWSSRQREAELAFAEAAKETQRLKTLKESMGVEIKGMGLDYHFADLTTGQRMAGSVMTLKLQNRIDSLKALAIGEGIAANSIKRINKAERVLPKMVNTIDFVLNYVRREVHCLA